MGVNLFYVIDIIHVESKMYRASNKLMDNIKMQMAVVAFV